MKYHKIPESSIQAELELDWDFLEHSRTYQLFGIIWNNFSQGYPPTKSEGYSFGVVRVSISSVRPSGTISQYLLVRFDSFFVQMIGTMDSRYSISLVKINPLTLELLPLFWYMQL